VSVKYWVTWKDESDSKAARASALIWGLPDGQSPPQLSGHFEAGPFDTRAEAVRYESAIGTGAILPPPGTPIVGNIHLPSNPLAAVGDFFSKLGQGETWVRIAEGVAGGLILIVAVSHLISNTKTGQAIIKTGKKAAMAAAL